MRDLSLRRAARNNCIRKCVKRGSKKRLGGTKRKREERVPMSTALLIIDPQIDFCCPVRGSLFVPGAERDMQRLAQMVRLQAKKIDAIHVTLDTHHVVHIAHPIFWVDAAGQHPDPFTLIRADEVESKRWTTTRPEMRERALAYVQALERGGRYALCIWPYHCLVGSEGHAVKPALFDALRAWEAPFALVNYIPKGSNIFTEHYSAIRAEVPDPADPATQTNRLLVETLRDTDRVLIAGEAGSHCVANTVRDLVEELGNGASRLTLLTDAISPVPGFESLQESFLAEMMERKIQFATTQTAFQ
jgi:nicotinamidase-related amidase